jgi:nucleoid DNA-binding protein
MSFFGDVAETAGQPRKVVVAVYDAVVEVIQDELKATRRVRIPKLGILKIKFSPARPKKKGINPFTKEEMMFKAKPASNKVRFNALASLKDYVARHIKPQKS